MSTHEISSDSPLARLISAERLLTAWQSVRAELLRERSADGRWSGEVSRSAVATAAAVSALALVERHEPLGLDGHYLNELRGQSLSQHVVAGLNWLADHQNPDGGWGDTDRSYSNLAATMLAMAAFHLTCVPADHVDMLERAERFVREHGGVAGLWEDYGHDRTFVGLVLMNCALAGIVPWNEVPRQPLVLAVLPAVAQRLLRLPMLDYALPSLVAIGLARHFHHPPLNPLTRLIRRFTLPQALSKLEGALPWSGGYLESAPLTAFVVMSLASSGRVDHPVVRRGVEFLVDTARANGSWPIATEIATWNTTQAINALTSTGDLVEPLESLEYLLRTQNRRGTTQGRTEPGGWGWTDLSGAVPDVDDTAGALLALAALRRSPSLDREQRQNISGAAREGLRWLMRLQNADGGWPWLCPGRGKLPYDRSGPDLTAHALRALKAWQHEVAATEYRQAVDQALAYLAADQLPDGSWLPLWYGNQDDPRGANPTYGTARVLLAYRDLGQIKSAPAWRGVQYLIDTQRADGGWGSAATSPPDPELAGQSGSEETAVAVEALLSAAEDRVVQPTLLRGLEWLIDAVEAGRHRQCAPIGFYFARLWYYEKLYPLTFTAAALGQAVRRILPDDPTAESPAGGTD